MKFKNTHYRDLIRQYYDGDIDVGIISKYPKNSWLKLCCSNDKLITLKSCNAKKRFVTR